VTQWRDPDRPRDDREEELHSCTALQFFFASHPHRDIGELASLVRLRFPFALALIVCYNCRSIVLYIE